MPTPRDLLNLRDLAVSQANAAKDRLVKGLEEANVRVVQQRLLHLKDAVANAELKHLQHLSAAGLSADNPEEAAILFQLMEDAADVKERAESFLEDKTEQRNADLRNVTNQKVFTLQTKLFQSSVEGLRNQVQDLAGLAADSRAPARSTLNERVNEIKAELREVQEKYLKKVEELQDDDKMLEAAELKNTATADVRKAITEVLLSTPVTAPLLRLDFKRRLP